MNFTGALLLLCCRAVVKQIVKLNEQIKNRGILEKSEISGKSCSNSEMHQKVSFLQYTLRAKRLFQYYILNFRAKSTKMTKTIFIDFGMKIEMRHFASISNTVNSCGLEKTDDL